jgi:hypothetical protein
MLSFNQLYENKDYYPEEIEIERDRIIDKIGQKGLASLTEYEREFLDSFKDGNQEEVYAKKNKTFEDEMFKFVLSKIEPYDGDERGTRYRGTMYFKDLEEELTGSIVETEDGRVISSFRIDSDKTDYDIVDPEDLDYYSDFLNYVADELRDK